MISKHDFLDWKANPVTEELFEKLASDRDAIVSAWIEGGLANDRTERYAGVASCIDGILEWNPIEE